MIDQIVSSRRVERYRHGDWATTCETGLELTMRNGSVWHHPYSGAQPIQITPPLTQKDI